MQMSYWSAPGQYTIHQLHATEEIDNARYFNHEKVKSVILHYFGISEKAIMRKDRRAEIVYTRFFLSYFLNIHAGISKTQIGIYLGQDHTSVINGVRTIKEQLSLRANNKYKEDHYRIYLLLTAPTLGNGQTH